MATTNVTTNSPMSVEAWSAALAAESLSKMYWAGRFIGKGQNNIIEEKTEIESDDGDTVHFDLSVQLRNEPTFGDDVAEGTEENLRFFSDEIHIDQIRHPVSAGGKMSRKRTRHDLRKVARARLSDYFSALTDQMIFMYLSGARGANADFVMGDDFTGFGGNSFRTPDSDHLVYGGDATAKANLDATDIMNVALVEKLATKAEMMRAADPESANMMPVTVEGDLHYVLLMSPYQANSLRTASGSDWVDYQKAAAGAEGRKSPLFRGKLGMINDVVLHKHPSVIRFSDYGAGSNVAAARALFMGRQAGVCAYGTPSGVRMQWDEERKDYKNKINVNGGMIWGIQKARFNGRDFGLISVDTAAAAV